ncbi:hypothetical protein M231_03507 [Tremella mesenterica]|uniref:Uncharacterized protein n=1 Tax=Tremella mesenterica TaxID=5217 RepID=A0A4Q1BN25_TREME|nr:uncharacterized protein TREMEDRAFT_61793 [Tremella mesenterica DSM 1558]EIW70030.1 hypothetical protein TREMEDRAFT_61793 [Tremella mesenterica DSM 1558]RXK39150.1 hypothetical protein M231_03507 [Tremella mesenterica]
MPPVTPSKRKQTETNSSPRLPRNAKREKKINEAKRDPAHKLFEGVHRCFGCQKADIECVVLPTYNKCVCCAGECSFAPSAETMAEMLCLQSAASTIRAVMSVVESDKTDKATRKAAAERVKEAMELVARVAVRSGGVLDKRGKKVYAKIPDSR